jgi:hypothetical protein
MQSETRYICVLCHFTKEAALKNTQSWNIIEPSVSWKHQVTSWCTNYKREM